MVIMRIVEDKIRELIEPLAKTRGYCVVDLSYKREGSRFVLRLILDKDGGINMDECARLNVELGEILDKENIIAEEYVIEVSSPGLDRKLEKDTDFKWAMGKKIRVSTYAPIDGKNVFSGILIGMGVDTIVLDENGVSYEVPRDKIANAKLEFNIDWSKK